MNLLLFFSLFVIIAALFPAGILFALLARKITQSERSLWFYSKALLLMALLIFAFFYLSSYFLLKSYSLGMLIFLALCLLGISIAWSCKKGWHKYEKMAVIFWEILVFLVIIFLSANLSLYHSFPVNSAELEPTYPRGSRFFYQINNQSLNWEYPKGSIVVFQNPEDKTKTLIRKIIATAGDSVKINGGQLFVNDQIVRGVQPNELIVPVTLKKGEYFVLAEDGRNHYDSKTFGLITNADIHIRLLFEVSRLLK